MEVYTDFGFTNIDVKIALRPDNRIGSDAVWDEAEEALRGALRSCGVSWTELPPVDLVCYCRGRRFRGW